MYNFCQLGTEESYRKVIFLLLHGWDNIKLQKEIKGLSFENFVDFLIVPESGTELGAVWQELLIEKSNYGADIIQLVCFVLFIVAGVWRLIDEELDVKGANVGVYRAGLAVGAKDLAAWAHALVIAVAAVKALVGAPAIVVCARWCNVFYFWLEKKEFK